jgi:hypothetical protein
MKITLRTAQSVADYAAWRQVHLAARLKRLTLHWAASNGVTEVYTWTQRGNEQMRRLNERLGYAYGQQSITVRRALPL